jgi:hypothetical protein
METKDTCLYIHTRKSDGGIFYVGIGDKKRPYTKNNRNKYWYDMVNEHGGFDVKILKTDMNWEEACCLEYKMISFYGRIRPSKVNLNYGCLLNMTDGGQGTKGRKPSEKQKKALDKTGFNPSNETIKKMKDSHIGLFSGEKHPLAKKVICIDTNKIYGCAKDAAKDKGINYSSLKSYLSGRNPNKTSLRYL